VACAGVAAGWLGSSPPALLFLSLARCLQLLSPPAHRSGPSRRLSTVLVAAVLDSGRRHGVKVGIGGSGGVAMGIVGGGSGLGAPVRARNREEWFF
jgi:hypothetical protein